MERERGGNDFSVGPGQRDERNLERKSSREHKLGLTFLWKKKEREEGQERRGE